MKLLGEAMTREELRRQIIDGLQDSETKTVEVPRHTLYLALMSPKKKPLSELIGEFTAELLTGHCIGHSITSIGVEFFRRV